MSAVTKLAAGAPLISVVICTHNRAELLRSAIKSIINQEFLPNDFELIVVDNASTDHTLEIAKEFSACGNIRYIFEPEVGLCAARNTGWKVAGGRYIAYFDDDAIAAPGWLAAIVRGFEAAQDTMRPIGAIGGRVRPIWEVPQPPWLADEIAGSLTIVDWGPEIKPISDLNREWLVGANLAVPKAVLEDVGGFHPWLDRVGSNLLSSGDVFLQREIIRRGYCCLYVPAMTIDHLAAASRLNKGWFLRRFYWQGISDAIMHLIERSPSRRERLRLAAARTMRLVFAPQELRSLVLSGGDDRVKFKQKCLALINVGFIAGLLGVPGR